MHIHAKTNDFLFRNIIRILLHDGLLFFSNLLIYQLLMIRYKQYKINANN